VVEGGGSAGNVMLTVRYGARPIEFEKGKAAIAVGKKDKLVPTQHSPPARGFFVRDRLRTRLTRTH
jgi:hypothetical protein